MPASSERSPWLWTLLSSAALLVSLPLNWWLFAEILGDTLSTYIITLTALVMTPLLAAHIKGLHRRGWPRQLRPLAEAKELNRAVFLTTCSSLPAILAGLFLLGGQHVVGAAFLLAYLYISQVVWTSVSDFHARKQAEGRATR